SQKEFVFPPPHSSKGSVNLLRLEMKRTLFATVVRSDLECETRTKLPINHYAEMLTRTLRSETGLFAPSPIYSG
ncbi:hypothetical protein V9Z49_10175, partial [Streptococcus suis]|uniref:hypothetical protein n=1 Tax=Streptococcus suis TaxID=1307 RepID=UPI003010559B